MKKSIWLVLIIFLFVLSGCSNSAKPVKQDVNTKVNKTPVQEEKVSSTEKEKSAMDELNKKTEQTNVEQNSQPEPVSQTSGENGVKVGDKEYVETKTEERYGEMKAVSSPFDYEALTKSEDAKGHGMLYFIGTVIKIQPAEELPGGNQDLYYIKNEKSEVYLVKFFGVLDLKVGDKIIVYGLHMGNSTDYPEYGNFVPEIAANFYEHIYKIPS